VIQNIRKAGALLIILLAGCALARPAGEDVLTLPDLPPAVLDGGRLRVVATTSIIGDVVGRVGGDQIELTVLLQPGEDPHSHQSGATDMAAAAAAHVIFVNGWDLEEGLLRDLAASAGDVPIVPISAGIVPLPAGASPRGDEHEEGDSHPPADPHVWFEVRNVMRWAQNAARVLAQLDPAHAAAYDANSDAYLTKLAELEIYAEAELAAIPPERRVLVTNHDALGYFARAYGFEILGTVIPAASTLAEPSAADLADLIAKMDARGVCAIFSETTVNDTLAQAVAQELAACAQVRVIPLLVEATGLPGSGADSYIGMFRANVDAIIAGLKQPPDLDTE
jgi:ABC-type Zn uptake system ZnuABC Zn-binding protein ZnuA